MLVTDDGDELRDFLSAKSLQIEYPGPVHGSSLLAVINAFGDTAGPCDVAPQNPDGTVGNDNINIDDLLAVINAFGPCE